MPVPTLTIADLAGRDVCTVEEAGAVLGLSRGSAYQACRTGELPAIRVGSRYVIPVRRLAALLGADLEEPETAAPAPLAALADQPEPAA